MKRRMQLATSRFICVSYTDPQPFLSFVTQDRNKMERGISKASENELLVIQARNQVESQFQQAAAVVGSASSPDSPDSGSGAFVSGASGGGGGFIDTPLYTFTLPDLTVYPGESVRMYEHVCN